jgi:hypothetical protein
MKAIRSRADNAQEHAFWERVRQLQGNGKASSFADAFAQARGELGWPPPSKLPRPTCCLCHSALPDFGDEYPYLFNHNPWPLDDREEARCCTPCNDTHVMRARAVLHRIYDEATKGRAAS